MASESKRTNNEADNIMSTKEQPVIISGYHIPTRTSTPHESTFSPALLESVLAASPDCRNPLPRCRPVAFREVDERHDLLADVLGHHEESLCDVQCPRVGVV